MSIWNAISSSYSLEEAFHAKDCTSRAMIAAIKEWSRLYYQREPTEESDPCQQIAYTIVAKLTKTVFSEYAAVSDDRFVQNILIALDAVRKKALQLALIGGEAWIKPVPKKDGFFFSVVRREDVLIFGRDAEGVPIDIGTVEFTRNEGYFYILLERRYMDRIGRLTIRNELYRSSMENTIGQRVPLASLERYQSFPEEYTFSEQLNGLGLARLKTPMENCVDGSQDGVSVYAPAVGLIHNIDRNEALLNGEFERGQSRIIVSDDLLSSRPDGRRWLDDKLFVGGFDENPEDMKPIIFSPPLRDASFLARKQEYLRSAENIIGLKRGLLSEVEAAERTATEVTSSAGDYNLTIIDFQQMFEDAAKEAVQLCGTLGRLYHVPDAHEISDEAVSIDWGNGILYDEEKIWADYLDMEARGLLKPEIALGWRFGMPSETEADLAAIRDRYMPKTVEMVEDDM